MKKTVFISADHGLAIVYFLQSDVVKTLLNAGVRVVLLTDDALKEKITERFGQDGLIVEGLRFAQAREYEQRYKPSLQWWVAFLRRTGPSRKINLEAADSYVYQVWEEAHARRKMVFPLMHLLVKMLRWSRWMRWVLVRFQRGFTPTIYTDLFEKYQPEMVIASTPGWRLDRYLLREAAKRGILNTTVIVGWDNSSSYNLVGADMDYAVCWSELQKQEMVDGSDWDPARVFVGGIPSYDGYHNGKWLISREAYFKLHGLDENKKLISYASSFITFSPNIQNIEALAGLVNGGELSGSAQVLIRLHPNHFLNVARFKEERERVREIAREMPDVHVVEPVALGGELGHYSGEDMDEKTSMMAHSDVFVTVYSTMVVEASLHERPVVSACIDSKVGWPGKFTLPLSKIGNWPTHLRFRESGSGRVAHDQENLKKAIKYYLQNPDADHAARRAFVERECTYLDGKDGQRVGEILLGLLEKGGSG